MVSESARTCVKCGGKIVRKRTRPGRIIRYRNMNALKVPTNIPIPTCRQCHAEYIDAETAQVLEEALRNAYRDELRLRARQAIDIITCHISQRQLEILLGISQGYLSRLRAGSGNPSPELISHLALIAHDPEVRLEELRRFWGSSGRISSGVYSSIRCNEG